MVVKMMRWMPWPSTTGTTKYEVRVCVQRLEGADRCLVFEEKESEGVKLAVEIRWKRQSRIGLSSLRRSANMSLTKEVGLDQNGGVCWDEEFHSVCSLSGVKDNSAFQPWEICFNLLNGRNQGPKGRASVVGTGSLNLAEYTDMAGQNNITLSVPLKLINTNGVTETCPYLSISMRLLELRLTQDSTESVQKAVVPLPSPSPPRSGQIPSVEKDELSALKAGLRKVRILTNLVSSMRTKKACHEEDSSEGRCTVSSEDAECSYPFDSDSCDDDLDERDYDEDKAENNDRKSFSYGTLAYANCVGSSYYSTKKDTGEDEEWIYFSHHKSDVGYSTKVDSLAELGESYAPPRKHIFLPWKRRKLNLKSPRAKGEPLLKDSCREEGGDDIDFDRRQLSSVESLYLGWYKSAEDSITNGFSEFGDDYFTVGSWEQKDIISRDGVMKLQTQVFFASIDQRSERAAGESACTALVAVIADWFQTNRDNFPIKSQFDSLIREGSMEWRRLCENEVYRERFPDKHFDLDTIVQAKIRPLTVVPEKSFVGFFHPDEMDETRFGFLQSAMSFDGIWDEIEKAGADIPEADGAASLTYIVSWNDHFFVLKVEPEAYYIIDTLGERLFEGCNQAYILKFDRNTVIQKVHLTSESSDDKPITTYKKELVAVDPNGASNEKTDPNGNQLTQADEKIDIEIDKMDIVCRGKECCKEYIKSMLTAIPLRELLVDIKKGLMGSVPLYQRLQIEFHYTEYVHPVTETSLTTSIEAPVLMPEEECEISLA